MSLLASCREYSGSWDFYALIAVFYRFCPERNSVLCIILIQTSITIRGLVCLCFNAGFVTQNMRPWFVILKKPKHLSCSQNLSQTLPAKFPPMKEVPGDLSGPTAGSGNFLKRSNSPERMDRKMSVSALEYNRLVESERMNSAKVEELTNR